MSSSAVKLRKDLRDQLRAMLAGIPPEQAENDGWPQLAMPAMLAELEIAQAPELTWFVAGLSPLYASSPADGWRYCHTASDPDKPDLLGLACAGPPRRIYLRADVSLPRAIQTLGHELWHVREFDRGESPDEKAADEFGAQSTARFLASQYR